MYVGMYEGDIIMGRSTVITNDDVIGVKGEALIRNNQPESTLHKIQLPL